MVERSEMVTKKLDDLLEEIPGKGVEAWHFARFISFGVHFFFGMMFWYICQLICPKRCSARTEHLPADVAEREEHSNLYSRNTINN